MASTSPRVILFSGLAAGLHAAAPSGEKRSMSSIMLHKPEAGHAAEVFVQPGQTYLFDFDSDAATYESQAADVLIVFDDGALLRLKDFLHVTAQDDFTIELLDGVQVSGSNAAAMFTMDLDELQTGALAHASAPALGAAPDGDMPILVSGIVLSSLPVDDALAPQEAHARLMPPFSGSTGQTAPVSDGLVYGPGQAAGHLGEPLQIEDLLDTTRPARTDMPPKLAFESLLDTHCPDPGEGPDGAMLSADWPAQFCRAEQDILLLALFDFGPL